MKNSIKILSTLLCIALLVVSLPLTAFTLELDVGEETVSNACQTLSVDGCTSPHAVSQSTVDTDDFVGKTSPPTVGAYHWSPVRNHTNQIKFYPYNKQYYLLPEISHHRYRLKRATNGTPLLNGNNVQRQNITSSYTYTYDEAGRITEIRVGGVLKCKYTYDSIGQLVREDNAFSNYSYTYSYDEGGNITERAIYSYTTGTLGSAKFTYSYSYGSSISGDRLTAYRGTSFSYDGIGNPLTYYKGTSYTMTWENGRRLASVVKGTSGSAITYLNRRNFMKTIICKNIVTKPNESGMLVISKDESKYISFEECAKNFTMENSLKNSTCVGTRDITRLSFVFYTQPKCEIFFEKKFFKNLFSGKSADKRFSDLQKLIINSGYTTFDMS